MPSTGRSKSYLGRNRPLGGGGSKKAPTEYFTLAEVDEIVLTEVERIESDFEAELRKTQEDLAKVKKRLKRAENPSEELLEQKQYLEQRVEMGEQRRAKAREILEQVK